ncbi:MAG: hypothetical protein LGB01_06700 [Sulfurovum sp.]|nr:hypothetical protein [Sulfurovum sp.]
MRTIGWMIAFALFFLGCSSKGQSELFATYQKKKTYHKYLLKTEKIQLHDENLTRASLIATYLYDSKNMQHNQEDECFIVGLYIDDDSSKRGIHHFNFTLNGVRPKKIKPIDSSDSRLKELSFVSNWRSYFIVTFPHDMKQRLKLVFKSNLYGEGALYFTKKFKYTFTQKVF